MSNSYNEPESIAERALELLEQSYAYYQAPLQMVVKGQAKKNDADYYEYVKAA